MLLNERQYQELITMWISYMCEIFKDDKETQNESDMDLEKYAFQTSVLENHNQRRHLGFITLCVFRRKECS